MSNRPAPRRKTLAALAVAVLAAAAGWAGLGPGAGDAAGPARPAGEAAPAAPGAPDPARAAAADYGRTCPVAALPAEADEVIEAILRDPARLDPRHDGAHFGNYEGRLPRRGGSYYREYTVDTPGVGHRGARRIVVGGGTAADPDVWYYTPDHYDSFCAIPDAED